MNYNTQKSEKANICENILVKPSDFLAKPTAFKNQNILLSKIHLLNKHESKAKIAMNCGNLLEVSVNANNERKLKRANFCKARLCPFCNSRLALKRRANLSCVLHKLYKTEKQQLLFLTLTVRNCCGDELRQEIKKIFSAWRYMSDKNPLFKQSIKGWYRSLEVTHNKETDEYHPHLHIVLSVNPEYFTTAYYITQQTWVDMWKSALKINYEPIVHICKEYKNKNSKAELDVISEACKYATKSTDYIIPSDLILSAKIVEVYDKALRRQRLVAYGGILKSIHEKLKLDESNYDDPNIEKDLNCRIEHYIWSFRLRKYQPFNPQQTASFKNDSS